MCFTLLILNLWVLTQKRVLNYFRGQLMGFLELKDFRNLKNVKNNLILYIILYDNKKNNL